MGDGPEHVGGGAGRAEALDAVAGQRPRRPHDDAVAGLERIDHDLDRGFRPPLRLDTGPLGLRDLDGRRSQPNGARNGDLKFVSRSMGRIRNRPQRARNTFGGSMYAGWFGRMRNGPGREMSARPVTRRR